MNFQEESGEINLTSIKVIYNLNMYKIIPPYRLENGAVDRLEATINGVSSQVRSSFCSNDLKKKTALGDNELHRITDVIYSSFMALRGSVRRERERGRERFQVQFPLCPKTTGFISWLGVNL